MSAPVETWGGPMKATGVLVGHQSFLRSLFDGIERELRDVKTSAEVAAFAQLAERMMSDYGAIEKVQDAQGYSNHQDCVSFLIQAQQARPVMEAKSLLLLAIHMLRDHVVEEEQGIMMPAAETFQARSLQS